MRNMCNAYVHALYPYQNFGFHDFVKLELGSLCLEDFRYEVHSSMSIVELSNIITYHPNFLL